MLQHIITLTCVHFSPLPLQNWIILKRIPDFTYSYVDQTRPLPNMPLGHRDYFELKAIEKKQRQGELLSLYFPGNTINSPFEGIPHFPYMQEDNHLITQDKMPLKKSLHKQTLLTSSNLPLVSHIFALP